MVEVAASILNANMEKLAEEIADVCNARCDKIHVDVMDGVFVQNKTDGQYMMKKAIEASTVPIEVHLMVQTPLEYFKYYMNAETVIFHEEVVNEVECINMIEYLHKNNIKAGISIKPTTSVGNVEKYIDIMNEVLIMTVEPGYGGQTLIEDTLLKVKYLRDKYPLLSIEVDGGINEETSQRAVDVGANILVVGSAIFKSNDRETVVQICKGHKV